MLKKLILLCLLLLGITPAAAQQGAVWKAEYYANPYLIGERAQVRTESHVNFDWGLSSPAEHIPSDGFSARFTTDVYFTAGTYRFSVLADDRVRVSVAFAPIIDTFDNAQPGALLSADVTLPEGVHHLQIDYQEEVREAYISFDWIRLDTGTEQPALPVLATSGPLVNPNPWEAAYYANPSLSEPHQFKRTEPQGPARTFNTAPPREDMPQDHFSVRWESIQPLAAGTYQIRLRAKDGVRVYIDGNRVVDAWGNSNGQLLTHTFTVPQGEYRFTVEYFKQTGHGYVEYNLVLLDSHPVDSLYTLPGTGTTAAPSHIPVDVQSTGYIITAADNLNLRSGPGTGFDVLARIPYQAQAAVLARNATSGWWMIEYQGTRGWVNAYYGRIQPEANINSIPVVE